MPGASDAVPRHRDAERDQPALAIKLGIGTHVYIARNVDAFDVWLPVFGMPATASNECNEESSQKVDDVEKAYDFFRKNNFFDRTGKISRVKLNAIIDALVGLGDLPARGNVERFLLPGVAQLSD